MDYEFGVAISGLRFRDYDLWMAIRDCAFWFAISGLRVLVYDFGIAIRVSGFGCVGCLFVAVRVVVVAVVVGVGCR